VKSSTGKEWQHIRSSFLQTNKKRITKGRANSMIHFY
jgi:hypothetical protein